MPVDVVRDKESISEIYFQIVESKKKFLHKEIQQMWQDGNSC